MSFCSPDADACIEKISKRHSDCRISCTGLYAVVWYQANDSDDPMKKKFAWMKSEYHRYLNDYANNLLYNSSSKSLSRTSKDNINLLLFYLLSASPKGFPSLQLVQIYFVPASYDEIERDRKLTLEAQLGLIGGTMGLLTGFSILRFID